MLYADGNVAFKFIHHGLTACLIAAQENGQPPHDFRTADDDRFNRRVFDGIGDFNGVFRHGHVAQGQMKVQGRALMADVATSELPQSFGAS